MPDRISVRAVYLRRSNDNHLLTVANPQGGTTDVWVPAKAKRTGAGFTAEADATAFAFGDKVNLVIESSEDA